MTNALVFPPGLAFTFYTPNRRRRRLALKTAKSQQAGAAVGEKLTAPIKLLYFWLCLPLFDDFRHA